MFRPKLLFTSLAAIALAACSPQDPQAVTSAAIAKQVILPTYSRWVEADRQLAVSALAYCQGKETLETARADFLHAQKAWAELQPLLIGPLAEGNRSWQVQFWPDKKNLVGRQVEQLVVAQPQIDAAALAKSSVVVQGLSAYEYILFDSNINLAVPARRDVGAPQVLAGKNLFYQAGCSACHTPTFTTSASAAEPELANQVIHPYSDLLLHDMGPGLADNRTEFAASGRDWRTPPLWGIGLTQAVSGHTQFLHDGRARNLLEAVLWHGGEAEPARQQVLRFNAEQRAALLAFLNSL